MERALPVLILASMTVFLFVFIPRWFSYHAVLIDGVSLLVAGGDRGGAGSWPVERRFEGGGGGDECDFFDGEWIWDESYPLYESKDCPFLDEGFRCTENGRPDSFYTKWRWKPKRCALPSFDAKKMLERLRNKRVVFAGDSIGRNQWESLLCMFSADIVDKSSIYEVNGSPITKHKGFLVFKFEDYNCTLEYYRSPFLVRHGSPPRGQRSMKTLFKWIQKEVNTSKTRVFFRTYSPAHFRNGDWRSGGTCHQEMLPESNRSQAASKSWLPFLEPFAAGPSYSSEAIELLNISYMTGLRKDGHQSLYHHQLVGTAKSVGKEDCSHWCLPGVPDAWNQILYAMF